MSQIVYERNCCRVCIIYYDVKGCVVCEKSNRCDYFIKNIIDIDEKYKRSDDKTLRYPSLYKAQTGAWTLRITRCFRLVKGIIPVYWVP